MGPALARLPFSYAAEHRRTKSESQGKKKRLWIRFGREKNPNSIAQETFRKADGSGAGPASTPRSTDLLQYNFEQSNRSKSFCSAPLIFRIGAERYILGLYRICPSGQLQPPDQEHTLPRIGHLFQRSASESARS
jgi:hypothetical protein